MGEFTYISFVMMKRTTISSMPVDLFKTLESLTLLNQQTISDSFFAINNSLGNYVTPTCLMEVVVFSKRP
jgi:hypothetical protein